MSQKGDGSPSPSPSHREGSQEAPQTVSFLPWQGLRRSPGLQIPYHSALGFLSPVPAELTFP